MSESSSDMMDLDDGVESTPGLLTTPGAPGSAGGGGVGAGHTGRHCHNGGGQDPLNGSVLAQNMHLASDLQARIAAPLMFSSNIEESQHPQQSQQQQQHQNQNSCKPQFSTYCSLQRHNSALAVSIETDV